MTLRDESDSPEGWMGLWAPKLLGPGMVLRQRPPPTLALSDLQLNKASYLYWREGVFSGPFSCLSSRRGLVFSDIDNLDLLKEQEHLMSSFLIFAHLTFFFFRDKCSDNKVF